jgi:hypothetical protein
MALFFPSLSDADIIDIQQAHNLLRSRTNAFASFLEKKKAV